jgi:hypothetical protein
VQAVLSPRAYGWTTYRTLYWYWWPVILPSLLYNGIGAFHFKKKKAPNCTKHFNKKNYKEIFEKSCLQSLDHVDGAPPPSLLLEPD